MQYLMIENAGETQAEAFTVLGASSARGNEEAIGQFGSGAKHGILSWLRAGLQILIYCGKTKIVPQTQPQTIHGQIEERVCFRIGNKLETSSMTLGFGELDWGASVQMALREFFSNALDAVGGQWERIRFEFVDKPRAKSGTTRVYLEVTQEVREYLSNLHRYFLHVNGEQNQKLLAKNPSPCRFYRKGVFVHEVTDSKSVYNYNCGDELPIDESRNLDSYKVRQYAAQLICDNPKATQHCLRLAVDGTDCYETSFSSYSLTYSACAEAFRELYGNEACVTDSLILASKVRVKGIPVVVIPNASGWLNACIDGGIDNAVKHLSRADKDGLELFEPSAELQRNVDAVWNVLVNCELTCGKDKPTKIQEFVCAMDSGAQLWGYFDPQDGSVCVHRERIDDWKVILEELSHYVTGANDETRDFQDYAFRIAACMARLVSEL